MTAGIEERMAYSEWLMARTNVKAMAFLACAIGYMPLAPMDEK
jgi:hypothetical protein